MNVYRLMTTSCEESSTLYVCSDEHLTQQELDEKFHAAMLAAMQFRDLEYPPTDLAALFWLMENNPSVLEAQGLTIMTPAYTSSVFGWSNTDNGWASYANSQTGKLLADLSAKGYRLGGI